VGERAPLFALRDLQGIEIRLDQFRGKRPVVLVTGSYSCPIYRQRLPALDRLYEKYRDRAAFFILYTVEAHPLGSASPYADREWVTEENRRERILVVQPSSYEERVRLALECQRRLGSRLPVLVDGMNNAAWAQYGKAPNAAYLIDSQGEVQVRQGWFDPFRFEEAFLQSLGEEPPRWNGGGVGSG
jgi:hypothetical protein